MLKLENHITFTGLFCFTFALLGALFKDWDYIVKYGFFYGFSPFLVFTAAMQVIHIILLIFSYLFA